MEIPQRVQPQSPEGSPSGSFRENLRDAVRFWERGRLFYNFVLSAFAIAWIVGTWPHFRLAFTLFSLLRIGVLALLANVCYSAAYLVDIPIQLSGLAARSRWRWGLWLVGTLLAVLFENYWIADEIYPFVR